MTDIVEFYFPYWPGPYEKISTVPKGSAVVPDWRPAFRRALCGDAEEPLPGLFREDRAVLCVVHGSEKTISIPDLSPQDRRWENAVDPRSVFQGAQPGIWYSTLQDLEVEKIIEINTDAWVVAATRAQLSGTPHQTLEEVFRDLTKYEPRIITVDGVVQIWPTSREGAPSLTETALRNERRHRTLFGKSPTK
jgi:hypothetical protein